MLSSDITDITNAYNLNAQTISPAYSEQAKYSYEEKPSIRNISDMERWTSAFNFSVSPSDFEYDGKKFIFESKDSLDVSYKDGWFNIKYAPLEIYSGGPSYREALRDFYEDVADGWDIYVDTLYDHLDNDVLELRNEYLKRLTVE